MDTMAWIRKAVFMTTVAVVILAHHGRTQASTDSPPTTKSSPETTTNDTPNISKTITAKTSTVGPTNNRSQISKTSINPPTTSVTSVPIATSQPKMINCINYKCDNMTSTSTPCNFDSDGKLNISKALTCSGSKCYIKQVSSNKDYRFEAGCSNECNVTSTDNTTIKCCSVNNCNDPLKMTLENTAVVSRSSGLQAVMICLFIILNFK